MLRQFTRNTLIVQDGNSYLLQVYNTKSKDARDTACCLRIFPPTFQKARKDLQRELKGVHQSVSGPAMDNYTNTHNISETNGIAERAARRVNEGTATAMVQSGLPVGGTLRWNAIATCGTCKTGWPMARQQMRNMWCKIEGPLIPFGATVSHKPVSSKYNHTNLTRRCWYLHGISITRGWERVRRFVHRGLRRPRELASL